ncbi:MAG: UbiA family prenyltransferase [Nevskia sp.]|nr:UbiA family prenyltransferase [Nevskia sp.]
MPAAGGVQAEGEVPLAVDLDGTLVRSDLLLESLFEFVRGNPAGLFKLPAWLARGRAVLKQRLARLAPPDAHTLPYNAELLDYLRQEKSRGRRLVLATAADRAVAEAVAQELGLFDTVLASDGVTNLDGPAKRERLVAEYGEGGFDYAGHGGADLPVWAAARKAVLADAAPGFAKRVARRTPVERVLGQPAAWRDYLLALRPHQWIKNLLVFLPLIAAHALYQPAPLARALLAFAAFSLCAASVYLFNDLLDLQADRRHPHKRSRALASGRIGIRPCCALLAVLLAMAFGLAAWIDPWFLAVLALYYALTASYSLGLKDFVVLDVLLLAAGYAARVAAGAVAAGIALSAWLLAFCVFLFYSLALIKRFAELVLLRPIDGAHTHSRGYLLDDAGVIAAQGIASGYLAVLVLALYTNTATVHGSGGRYWLFWVNCLLLLYWVSYLWLMTDRGRVQDDPILFALKDRVSRALLAAMALVALAAA